MKRFTKIAAAAVVVCGAMMFATTQEAEAGGRIVYSYPPASFWVPPFVAAPSLVVAPPVVVARPVVVGPRVIYRRPFVRPFGPRVVFY